MLPQGSHQNKFRGSHVLTHFGFLKVILNINMRENLNKKITDQEVRYVIHGQVILWVVP